MNMITVDTWLMITMISVSVGVVHVTNNSYFIQAYTLGGEEQTWAALE